MRDCVGNNLAAWEAHLLFRICLKVNRQVKKAEVLKMVWMGVVLHAIGGVAAGSFYAPCKKIKSWAWETYWLVLGVFAWVLVPLFMAFLLTPQFGEVLAAAPKVAMGMAFLFGLLWGVGAITFGLSVRYLGMSLGFAVSLGFCAAFGTLIPPLVDGSFIEMVQTVSGGITIGGIVFCLAGIVVCGKAGMIREQTQQKDGEAGSYQFGKGVVVAVFAGVMSACMSFAFKAGGPVQETAVELGVIPVRSNIPLLVVILWGGFITNAFWCIWLSLRNRSFSNYIEKTSPRAKNWLLCAVAGTLWYFQFFFYGMGETQMGDYNFTSWSLQMAFVIITSNILGLLTGEWKGCHGRAVAWLYGGTAVLILATCIIGMGSSMAAH
jgi:L-rhamnose-H+ transport protein